MRRLDQVRATLRTHASLADAAFDAGFADQSHMTRQFKRAFGLSPGRWRELSWNCMEPKQVTVCAAAVGLSEAGLTHQVRQMDLRSGEHRGAAHLALNPAGKVPVLVVRTRFDRRRVCGGSANPDLAFGVLLDETRPVRPRRVPWAAM